MSAVYCETHGVTAHEERSDCRWPHYAAPAAAGPSMTAVETLDPREAITR